MSDAPPPAGQPGPGPARRAAATPAGGQEAAGADPVTGGFSLAVTPPSGFAAVPGPVQAAGGRAGTGTAVAPPASGPGRPGAARRGGPGRPPGAPGPGRRRRTRWRLAFFILSGVIIVGISLWALFGDRLLVVRSVSVSGTHLLLPGQVTAAADIPIGTPLANVDTAAVTRRVEAMNLVASASVSKEWPDILDIKVTERVPVMALKMADGSYDLIDRVGALVRNTKTKPAALPQLKTTLPGGALRGTPAAVDAAGVLAELKPWLAKQVSQVSAPTVGSGAVQVTLGLKDGKTVVWGGTDHAAQKDRELSILLPGHARTIDVSSPETVVTK